MSTELRTVLPMTEKQLQEVERALLCIGDARTRTRKAADTVRKDGADAHIVEALEAAERQIADLHRQLMQGTYYAIPDAG